jgi:hypothetical protein
MNDGKIDGLWHELNVLRIVVAYLVSREANKSENPDAVLRTIADELHRQFDDNTVQESQRQTMETARLAIDDLMEMARALTGN